MNAKTNKAAVPERIAPSRPRALLSRLASSLAPINPWSRRRRARRVQRRNLRILQRAMRIVERAELAYDGAAWSRRTEGWVRTGSSANAEVEAGAPLLRAGARELVRNNGIAANGVSVLTGNLVGEGIQGSSNVESDVAAPDLRTRSVLDKKALDARVDKLWERWITECTADGQLGFHGLQTLAARGVFESGEVFIRRRPRRASDGLTVPLQVELLEADLCDQSKTGTYNGDPITQGVEHNLRGQRTAYWLFTTHPGESSLFGSAVTGAYHSKRVPASSIAHVFEAQRPGQVRGVPWLAPVMSALRDFGDMSDAELLRRKLESCIVGISYGGDEAYDDTQGAVVEPVKNARGEKVETLQPGLWHHAPAGKRLELQAPASVGGVAEYRQQELTIIAAGLRLVYTLLTGDLKGANFSTIRAGLIEVRRMIKALRAQIFIRQFCDRIWSWFVDAAILAGEIPAVDVDGRAIWYRARWSPPQFESVDREKDARADAAELANGTTSLDAIIAGKGGVPDEVLRQIAAVNDKLRELGIKVAWQVGVAAPSDGEEEVDGEPVDGEDDGDQAEGEEGVVEDE